MIWEVRPEVFPLSTSSNAAALRALLSAASVTLTRASVATVQTSATTVVTSGIGVDDPRVGDGGYGPGLVNEELRTNQLVQARDASDATTYAGAGTAGLTYTVNAYAGPDGSSVADRVQLATGGVDYSRYWVSAGSPAVGFWTASRWRRSPAGGTTSQLRFYQNGGGQVVARGETLSTQWGRVSAVLPTSGVNPLIYIPEDSRDLVSSGGIVAGARDSILDLSQVEIGAFATEAILTTGATATRSADRLQLSQSKLAQCVNGGRLSLELDFTAKGARVEHTSAPSFFAHDGGNYAILTPATGTITVSVGGVTFGTTAVTWNAFDRVKVFIAIGGGKAAEVWTKVGAAAAVSRGGGSVMGTFPSIAALDLFNYQGGQSINAWIHRIRAWRNGRRPSWAA